MAKLITIKDLMNIYRSSYPGDDYILRFKDSDHVDYNADERKKRFWQMRTGEATHMLLDIYNNTALPEAAPGFKDIWTYFAVCVNAQKYHLDIEKARGELNIEEYKKLFKEVGKYYFHV